MPIVCDVSPCLLHMYKTLSARLKLYDQVEFIYDFLLDRLKIAKQSVSIAIHNTCSSAEKVIVPENVSCCGWAGDRGFLYPELCDSALAPPEQEIKNATESYSNSCTCEIGLSMNSGIAYKSLVYLVDKCAE